MPTLPTARREDGAPSNWDRYLDLLAHRGVPEKMRPWYVRRVEGFLKARRPASLSQVTAEEIAGYLQEVSAQGQLADWQLRQLVDALQLLFVDLAQCPAGKVVDWDCWKAGGRPLDNDHPTIVRYVLECPLECIRLRVGDLDFGHRGKGGNVSARPLPRLNPTPTPQVGLRCANPTYLRSILIRTVQELLGHADVSTTMIDTHVLYRGWKGVRSQLDALG